MEKPIFANKQHEIILREYMDFMQECVSEVSNDLRWKNYLEVFTIVIEYHNNYGKGVNKKNYWDWVMVLPINLSVLTNGFFAAIETKRNSTLIHSYRVVLNDMLQKTVDKIEKLEPVNE